MAVADTAVGVLNLKVVYYGPAGAGKTTNRERISVLIRGNEEGRITPQRMGENRIASVEIVAGSLGLPLGSTVVVRLETMQGEVSSAGRVWSAALADADGIVFVADSSPHARIANVRALAAIRERLEGRDRAVARVPVVMQWNKRDLEDARSIPELESELNHRCFPSFEASSRRGTGVTETLIDILKRTISAAHRRAGGRALAEAELEQAVMATIEQLSHSARAESSERYGLTIERQPAAWSEVREAVYSAESLGQETKETRMLGALERATATLNAHSGSGLTRGLMAGLLAGCDRTHGVLLIVREGTPRPDECEVVPPGGDPLNVLGTEQLQTTLVVPLNFGSSTFGRMVVYVSSSEAPPTPAERAYWRTAAGLTSVYLAWLAGDRSVTARRKTKAPGLDLVDHLDG